MRKEAASSLLMLSCLFVGSETFLLHTTDILQEDIERERARSGPARVRRQAEEWKQSAVEKIAQHVSRGPLLLLKQMYFIGSRVKVVTRHSRGARGSCTGTCCSWHDKLRQTACWWGVIDASFAISATPLSCRPLCCLMSKWRLGLNCPHKHLCSYKFFLLLKDHWQDCPYFPADSSLWNQCSMNFSTVTY